MEAMMKLCCAACGPLTEEEVQQFFPGVLPPGSVERRSLLHRLARQPDFPRLSETFSASASLRKVCAALMARRTGSEQGYSHIPEHDRSISAARYALLCGQVSEFLRLHKLFCGMRRLGLRPYMEHEEFWNGVLGKSWQGVSCIPTGQAKEEILIMLANRYALLPLPEGVELSPEQLPYMLALGWSLLRGDTQMRPRPATKDTKEEEVSIARAYWNLWAGSWEQAYRCFHDLFKARETLRYTVGSYHGAPLLLVGLITAVRTHAPQRVVELWSRAARELCLAMLAEDDTENAQDISGFFDALNLWDSVENRSCRHIEPPHLQGPLSCLPIAMGAQSFVQHTGLRLPLPQLVEAVQAVDARGLHLLAHYAASALLNIPGLEPGAQRVLRRIMSHCSFTPLFPHQPLPATCVVDHGAQLSALVEGLQATRAQWLFWDIELDAYGFLIGLEPRLVEKRPQSPGRKLSLEAVLDSAQVDCQDRRDLAMVSLARALAANAGLGIIPAAEALAGHPRLRVVREGYRRLLRMMTRPALIQCSVEGDILSLSMDKRQFLRVCEEEGGIITIPAFSPRMQAMVDFFCSGPILLDMAQLEHMRWLLASLAEYFTLQGELPERLLQYTPSICSLVLCAACEGESAYRLELRVEHLAGCHVRTAPGQGAGVLLLEGEQGAVCVRRAPEQELRAADDMLARFPFLSALEASQGYTWRTSQREQALRLLYEAGQQSIPIHWAEQKHALHIIEQPDSALRLSVEHEHADWLEIGASLPVDEKRVLSLMELMEAYHHRTGDYLPLPGNRFLHLSAAFAKQLSQLDETLHRERKKYVLPLASVPGLAALWQGSCLPAEIKRRCELLQECSSAPIPSGLQATLREYQAFGYRWLLARVRAGLGSCLADDMGLGKTIQLLALLLERAPEGPSLVVVPLSLISNWQTEAQRFAPGLRTLVFSELKRTELPRLQAGDIMLASYGQVVAKADFFCRVDWNIIALDEAQAIKNPASRRAQVVCKLRASARICLTGTPIENSLMDLWSLMHFLNPLMLGSRSSFLRASKERIEHVRRLTAPLILRRSKTEVLPQLPPITEVVIGVELSSEERSLYESCRRQALARVREGGESVTLLAELTRLRRLCCHGKLAMPQFQGPSSKLERLVELVLELRSAGHRALVFSQFTDVLDLAEAELSARAVTTLRLDGAMSSSARMKQVQAFQRGHAQVFLISLRAGGYGLNLTAADYVILLDPWWNPAVEAQAAGRSHRMGQHSPVTVCRLIAHDTVEERVMQMHDAKQALAESIIRDGTMPLDALRGILLHS